MLTQFSPDVNTWSVRCDFALRIFRKHGKTEKVMFQCRVSRRPESVRVHAPKFVSSRQEGRWDRRSLGGNDPTVAPGSRSSPRGERKGFERHRHLECSALLCSALLCSALLARRLVRREVEGVTDEGGSTG